LIQKIKNYLNKKRWIAFVLMAVIAFLLYLCFAKYTFGDVIASFGSFTDFWNLVSTLDFWLGLGISTLLQFIFLFWITSEPGFSIKASLPVYGPIFQIRYTKKIQQKTLN